MFGGIAQDQVGDDFQRFQVDVRLVEAVEEHQPVRAGFGQAAGDVGDGGKEGAELDRHGDLDAFANIMNQVDIVVFQLAGGDVGVGGEVVEVEFQRICAGILDLGHT